MSESDGVAGQRTIYELIGGEATISRLVVRFYELMDSLPEAKACRAVHPPSLERAAERLYDYLTGWLGGPPLFTDKHGPPMLRRRHFGAAIGGPEIEGWLACFRRAWGETVEEPLAAELVLPRIEALARHMRNRED